MSMHPVWKDSDSGKFVTSFMGIASNNEYLFKDEFEANEAARLADDAYWRGIRDEKNRMRKLLGLAEGGPQ